MIDWTDIKDHQVCNDCYKVITETGMHLPLHPMCIKRWFYENFERDPVEPAIVGKRATAGGVDGGAKA